MYNKSLFIKKRWQEGQCKVRPLRLTMPGAAPSGGGKLLQESLYRNVTGMKCDEAEIVIALDNGNVEVYDRRTLQVSKTSITLPVLHDTLAMA